MTAHGICFDFHYRPKLSQIGQNNSAAAADARLTALVETIDHCLPAFFMHNNSSTTGVFAT